MKATIIKIEKRSDIVKNLTFNSDDFRVTVELANGQKIKITTDSEPDWNSFNNDVFNQVQHELDFKQSLKRYELGRKAVRKQLNKYTGASQEVTVADKQTKEQEHV